MSRKSRRAARIEAAKTAAKPAPPARREEPKEFRAAGGLAVIQAAGEPGEDGKPKLAAFSGVAYTGQPMRPMGWGLPLVVDLDGVKIPSQHRPVLRQHDHEQIVGHTTKVAAGKDGIPIEGVFSGQAEHVAKVTEPAANGFQWQLSIGATPIRTEFLESGEQTEVNGRTITGPCTISRETELGEISFVPLGADGDTSAVVSASRGGITMFRAMLKTAKANGNVLAAKFSDDEIDKMDEAKAKAALKECMKAEEGDDEEKKAKAAEDDDEEKKTEARIAQSIAAATQRGIEAARQAEAAERVRVNDIKTRVARHGVTTCEVEAGGKKSTVDLVSHAITAGWSPDQAELHALRSARPSTGPIVYSTSHPELNEAVLEAAVFQATNCPLFEDEFYSKGTKDREPIAPRVAKRIKAELASRYPDSVQQAAHTHFKGRIGLQQLLTTIARSNGYRGPETISAEGLGEVAAACLRIQADGGSTISVSNVTANVLNKFMLAGYLFTEQAWREICAIRSTKDFKPTKSINLFGDFEFKDVGTSGELDNATLQDQAFSNRVTTRGRMLTIPRTTIINDDLGAFGQVPMLMGRGAGLRLNKVFWMTFMSPGFDDGGSTNFFAATHTLTGGQTGNSNLSSGGGSALGSAGLTAATLLFDNQIDPNGNPLGIDAEVLLYPSDLQTTALELMNSEWIIQSSGATTKQPSRNIWQGRYRPVKSRYLNKTLVDTVNGVTTTVTGSTAAWWLLANPAILAAIEVAFLNGQEMPTVQQAGPDFQFNVLGISTRAFFDMGVNMQNFRAAVKSAGS